MTEKAAAPSAKVLTADDILNAKDINIERVSVPEWGGDVFVRSLSSFQREKYVESIRRVKGKGNNQTTELIIAQSGAKLAQLTICDEKGTPLFENRPDVIDRLGQKSSKALQRVIDAAGRLNGLSDEAEEEAKND